MGQKPKNFMKVDANLFWFGFWVFIGQLIADGTRAVFDLLSAHPDGSAEVNNLFQFVFMGFAFALFTQSITSARNSEDGDA